MAALRYERAGAGDGAGEPVDLIEGVVEGEGGAGGGRYLEELHHRHGAVMSGSNGDAVPVEDGAEIVRMHALDHERDQARFVRRRADEAQSLDALERARCMSEQGVLVLMGRFEIER